MNRQKPSWARGKGRIENCNSMSRHWFLGEIIRCGQVRAGRERALIKIGAFKFWPFNGGSRFVCVGVAWIDLGGETGNIRANCKYNYSFRESRHSFVLFVESTYRYQSFCSELEGPRKYSKCENKTLRMRSVRHRRRGSRRLIMIMVSTPKQLKRKVGWFSSVVACRSRWLMEAEWQVRMRHE